MVFHVTLAFWDYVVKKINPRYVNCGISGTLAVFHAVQGLIAKQLKVLFDWISGRRK